MVLWALGTPPLIALPRAEWSAYIVSALLCSLVLLCLAALLTLRRDDDKTRPGAGLGSPDLFYPIVLGVCSVLLTAVLCVLWRVRSTTSWAAALLAANSGSAVATLALLSILLRVLRPRAPRVPSYRSRDPDQGPQEMSYSLALGIGATGFLLSGWLLCTGYVLGHGEEQNQRRSLQEAGDLAAVLVAAAPYHPRADLGALLGRLAPPPSDLTFALIIDRDNREVSLPGGAPTGKLRLQIDPRGDEYRCRLLPDAAPEPAEAALDRRHSVACVVAQLPPSPHAEGLEAPPLRVAVAVAPQQDSGFAISFTLSFLGAALLFALLGLILGQATSQDTAQDLTRLANELDSMDLGRGAGGLLVPLSASATQEINQLGQSLAGLRSHLFDEVSRYEQALSRAEDADRRKTEFIGDVGRELRAPLEEILGNARRLLSGDDGALLERQREDVHIIQQGAQHLLELLRDILDVSVLQGGLRLGRRAPMDVAALARDLLRSMRPLINDQRVQLRLEVQSGAPQALADAQAVRRILGNLLSNAVKFTSEGEIAVTLERWPRVEPSGENLESLESPSGDGLDKVTIPRNEAMEAGGMVTLSRPSPPPPPPAFLRVSVSDTGPGIPSEDIAKLFGEYIQLGTPWERARGTGLGLAIARRLCALHGGAIDVESEFGQGSTFRFTLPAVPQLPAAHGKGGG